MSPPPRTALSVNLNKVALVRNTRHLGIPSVTRAATLCLQAGAHGITVHPRPDARHIRAEDVRESLFIRTALEVEAIRRVTQTADPHVLEQLEENLTAQQAALNAADLAVFYDLDEALHAAIFSSLQAPRALRLLDAARAQDLPVVFTTIAYDQGQVGSLAWLKKATGMAALEAGSRLVEVDERLSPRPDEHLVVKTGASAFFGTALASYLASRRVDTVIVTGATTSGCVRASVVDAVQHGYPTLVPRDCVADRAQGPHEASLFDINEKYGDVVDLDDVLTYVAALA